MFTFRPAVFDEDTRETGFAILPAGSGEPVAIVFCESFARYLCSLLNSCNP